MIKFHPVVFALIMLASYASAQKATLKGTVNDTSSNQKLSNATISLLHAKDSILYKFTRTDGKGNFQFNNLDSGKYVFLITYPQYADYTDKFQLSDTSHINVGKILLQSKAHILQEVIVHSGAAIRIKGDTTEFAADSFKVQPNATVEDLLKKLPGIQIDKNGSITAQGEKVQKVLVDGEEFFGDDPTLVTQNLRADMVDKVQVYDKKSDQAAFTGIDDGSKQKTINLKLKDNKKNGYFGKLNLGGGTNGYHDSQLMFNDFKGKRKFALYGIVSNTGTSGLNWQDRDNYGESFANNLDYDETSGYYSYSGNNDELDSWDGRYNGQGIPLVQTGGLHYNNKWDNDKQSINGNYKALQLYVNGESSTRSEFILPDTLYFNNDKQSFHNSILRNRINGSYEYQIDSSTSIKITADGGIDHKITHLTDSSEARASDSSLVNNALRNVSTTGDNRTANSNFLLRKKFHKKGRTLSLNVSENFTDNTSNGYLRSFNNYYLKGALEKDTLTDQFKTNKTETIAFNSKLTYTEPLSKVASLIINYGASVNNSKSAVSSYNKGADAKYNSLDSLYSNRYLFNIFTNSGGLHYSLFEKKFKMNIGSDVGSSAFHQTNRYNDSVSTRSFINWYPRANISYQFTQQKRISLWYNGSTQQPDINQIQPVLSNADPLNITIGNPLLKPAFQNNISINFNDYKVITERGIFANINSDFTANSIVSKSYVDSFGRTVNQYVNLNGNRNLNGNLDYSFKLKKVNLYIDNSVNFNGSRYANIVNNLFNVTKSSSYTYRLSFYKDKEKKYSLNLDPSVTYTTSTSSIQSDIKTNYWSFNADPNAHIYFGHKAKYQLQTDCNFNLKQKTAVFTSNNNFVFWNAWIGRTFTKKDALLVKIAGHDLLNQNIGFNRTVNSNFITENTYGTIKRFFLLSIVWNFNKAGVKAPGENE